MLKELKFVQGAVAKKDFLPHMTHFIIEAGRVRSYNGMIALSSPIPFDIDCKPKGDSLVKAIANCTDTVTLSMTPAGKLRITSGKFKAFIECIDEDTAHVMPEGEEVNFDGELLLKALKVIYPFIGDDASRPWSNGVLLRGQSAYATNNVTLIEYWLGAEFPSTVNIPRAAIQEMLRVNEAPIGAQIASNSITFHYSDGRWIRSQLFVTKWPDLGKVLNAPAAPTPVDKRVFEALEALKPFLDKMSRVYFSDGVASTVRDATADGASYEIPGLPFAGIYNHNMLSLLKDVAQQADFSTYPAPCIFYGERLRGAIIGMRNV